MENSSSATRTRTNSALKWMANERAAIAGELEALRKTLVTLRSREDRLAAQLAALDETIVRFDENIQPDSIRPVNAWKERNGGRGRKQAFFLEALAQAAETGLTIHTLHEMWAHETNDPAILVEPARSNLQDSQTRSALKRLRVKGLVTCEPIPGGGHNDFVWKLVPQASKRPLPV